MAQGKDGLAAVTGKMKAEVLAASLRNVLAP